MDDFDFDDQMNDQTVDQPDLIDFNDFGNDVTKQSTYRPSYRTDLNSSIKDNDEIFRSLEGKIIFIF